MSPFQELMHKRVRDENAAAVVRVSDLLDVTPEDIAKRAGLELKTVRLWFDGKRPIPAREMLIVGGILKDYVRKIFIISIDWIDDPSNFMKVFLCTTAESWLLELRFELEERFSQEEIAVAVREATDYLKFVNLLNGEEEIALKSTILPYWQN